MDFPELSPEERSAILTAAARLKSMGVDPVKVLKETVSAEQWVREREPEGMRRSLLRPNEILSLLQQAVPLLNRTNTPEPLYCRKLIWSLNFYRMGRYVGTPSEGDDVIDEIADVIAVRQKGAGRPERPMFMNLGDAADWNLFKRMLDWFRNAQRHVPPEVRDETAIASAIREKAMRHLDEFPESWIPNLARALHRFRTRPTQGGFSPREVCALWFAEYKSGHPEDDLEKAMKEIERLRKLVNRHR